MAWLDKSAARRAPANLALYGQREWVNNNRTDCFWFDESPLSFIPFGYEDQEVKVRAVNVCLCVCVRDLLLPRSSARRGRRRAIVSLRRLNCRRRRRKINTMNFELFPRGRPKNSPIECRCSPVKRIFSSVRPSVCHIHCLCVSRCLPRVCSSRRLVRLFAWRPIIFFFFFFARRRTASRQSNIVLSVGIVLSSGEAPGTGQEIPATNQRVFSLRCDVPLLSPW